MKNTIQLTLLTLTALFVFQSSAFATSCAEAALSSNVIEVETLANNKGKIISQNLDVGGRKVVFIYGNIDLNNAQNARCFELAAQSAAASRERANSRSIKINAGSCNNNTNFRQTTSGSTTFYIYGQIPEFASCKLLNRDDAK